MELTIVNGNFVDVNYLTPKEPKVILQVWPKQFGMSFIMIFLDLFGGNSTLSNEDGMVICIHIRCSYLYK